MPPRSKARTRSHRRTESFSFETERADAPRTTRLSATDVCLWITFLATTVCFGGRAAIGQLVLVVGTAVMAGCWLLQQFASRQPRYSWTGSEWLWLMGVAIGITQIVPLPQEWLQAISPRMAQVLMPPREGDASFLGTGVWNQLSLAPWETASGLATFVSYALMFLVIVQRLRTLADVERTMSMVGMITFGMAVFALAQFFAGNGKFFWFYAHPYMTTDDTPHGCFTNHNHLAQFLALGIGPLIWSVLRRLPSNSDMASTVQRPFVRNHWTTIAVSLGLCCTVLTGLSTVSRGGLLAIAVAVATCVGVFWRLGRISAEVCLGLVVLVAGVGAVFNLTGKEAALAARVEGVTGREQIWLANIAVAQDFPILGTGVGTHIDAHQLRLEKPIEGHEFTHAECGYLQVMSETGFVGLGLAVLFILVSLWWCSAAMRNPEPQVSSIAVAVLASLLANLAHAAGDFFWYTPSCMLLLTIQLACVCRLYHLTREKLGRSIWTWNVSRLISVPALGSVLATAAWMVSVKLPSALAEPDQMRYVTLSLAGPTDYADEEDFKQAQQEKRQAAIRAARSNPHDSRLQETAALAYLEWFNFRQEHSENPMPLSQIRDAVKASAFESPQAMQEWLNQAVGKNLKLLRLATKHLRLALHESPLRAYAYVHLAELGFLNVSNEAIASSYLKHAVSLRPHDSDILFAVGRDFALNNHLDKAMPYWRDAIRHSTPVRDQITKLLAEQVTSEYFLTNLEPDWPALAPLAQAFDQVGRADEARHVWQTCIDKGLMRLKSKLSMTEREHTFVTISMAYVALGDQDRAVVFLQSANEQLSNSLPIRSQLAWNLFHAGRYSEAAEHLQWCASRRPDDKDLQHAAEKATKERIRTVAVREK